MPQWKSLDSAPTDGTIIRVYRGAGEAPDSAYYGIYHPNSPGKLCWRLNYTHQPIGLLVNEALWAPMEYPPDAPESWHGKKSSNTPKV
jgi:hypothetical protein